MATSSKQGSSKLPIFKIAGDKAVPTLKLDREVCVVGRAGNANLTLNAPQVSKLHAMVIQDTHGVYVRDLASKNGVEVNGSIIREATLHNDDVVRIGSYTLKCETGFTVDANGTVEAPTAELRTDENSFVFPEGRHTLLIGSRDGCDIKLNDASVAPVHALVFEVEGKRFVHSFAPANTTINGSPAHGEELHLGDELRVGDVALHYAPIEAEVPTAEESASDAAFIDDLEIEPHAEAELDVDMGGEAQAVEIDEEPAAVEVEDVAEAAPVEALDEIALEPVHTEEETAATSENIEPVEAVEAIESIETVDTLEPIESIEPVETIEPIEEVEPVEAIEPVETVESVEAIEPITPVEEATSAPQSPEPIVIELEPAPAPAAKVAPPPPPKIEPPKPAPAPAASTDELDMTPFDLPTEPAGKPQWLIDAEREEMNATIDWNNPEPEAAIPMEPALPELNPAELSASFGDEDAGVEALAPITEDELATPKPVAREPEVQSPAKPVIVEDDSEEEIEVQRPIPVQSEPATATVEDDVADLSDEQLGARIDELSAKLKTLKAERSARKAGGKKN